MSFEFKKTELDDVILIEPTVFADTRGFFMETYKESEFVAAGITQRFVQENHSRSTRGTLRGLHYQVAPMAQAKLVRVVSGEIFDVAVDIRFGSPTYRKWVSCTLSAENRRCLYVPPWCAHGFCVVSADAEVLYKTTAEYAPDCERGLLWNDPALGIPWPIQNPNISERDGKWPPFSVVV